MILFLLLALGAAVLLARLAHMQFLRADYWEAEARQVIYRNLITETVRGTIVDRNGEPMAQDRACWDLAIDYRAMTYDDRWISRLAIERIKKQEGITEQRELRRRWAELKPRLPAVKAQIADQISQIPAVVATACGPRGDEGARQRFEEALHERLNDIRARVAVLRQDRWARAYDPDTDAAAVASGAYDAMLNAPLQEETMAHTLVPNVSDELAATFNRELDAYPGLRVVDGKRRTYPMGSVAAHVIGALRPVAERDFPPAPSRTGLVRAATGPFLPQFDRPDLLHDDLGDLRGYLPGDRVGAFGLERLAESTLRGTRGVRLIEVGGTEVRKQLPATGQDVRTTLDMALQKDLTETILGPGGVDLRQDAGGVNQDGDADGTVPKKDRPLTLLVMGLDGQILAMISVPTFDLSQYDANIAHLKDDRVNFPLVNRALAAYPPGSTGKPFVAIAALEEKTATAADSVVCRGALYPGRVGFHCDNRAGHGPLQMVEALEESCNVYFYTMGLRLGPERLTKWYRDFGFDAPTGIGLREEGDGALLKITPQLQRERDIANREATFLGIGQGQITVTPLQLACAYATLLRGGAVVSPRLILEDKEPAIVRQLPIHRESLDIVREGMKLVVAGEYGTAHRALGKVRIGIAGKTGSAEDHALLWGPDGQPIPDERYPVLDRSGSPVLGPDGKPRYQQKREVGVDAWFAGYVPADNPRFVIVAFKQFGGHGGKTAVPLVHEAVLALERHGYLPKVDVAP